MHCTTGTTLPTLTVPALTDVQLQGNSLSQNPRHRRAYRLASRPPPRFLLSPHPSLGYVLSFHQRVTRVTRIRPEFFLGSRDRKVKSRKMDN